MRGRKKATPQMQYEKVWPERVCPVCGKRFLMRVRPDEWGYGSRDSLKSLHESHLTLLCSRPCMDEYSRRCIEERIRRMKRLTGYRIWKMYDQEYKPMKEIADSLGITVSGAENTMRDFEDVHWRDIDYMLCHT